MVGRRWRSLTGCGLLFECVGKQDELKETLTRWCEMEKILI